MINRFCRFVLFKLWGWRQIGELPTDKKYLFVCLPHTSNWDFVVTWLIIRSLELDITIFVKDVFFVWPITYFCRFFGVAPVNRRESTNFVDSIVNQYQERDQLAALITPEGTRKFQPNLKSGYYYIAKKANIPVVLAGPHFADKTFTILPARHALETFDEDADDLIEFCRTMGGKIPEYTFQNSEK